MLAAMRGGPAILILVPAAVGPSAAAGAGLEAERDRLLTRQACGAAPERGQAWVDHTGDASTAWSAHLRGNAGCLTVDLRPPVEAAEGRPGGAGPAAGRLEPAAVRARLLAGCSIAELTTLHRPRTRSALTCLATVFVLDATARAGRQGHRSRTASPAIGLGPDDKRTGDGAGDGRTGGRGIAGANLAAVGVFLKPVLAGDFAGNGLARDGPAFAARAAVGTGQVAVRAGVRAANLPAGRAAACAAGAAAPARPGFTSAVENQPGVVSARGQGQKDGTRSEEPHAPAARNPRADRNLATQWGLRWRPCQKAETSTPFGPSES